MFKKKFKSLDKRHTADIFLKRPDKYREIEILTSNAKSLITMGSGKSYVAASFKKDNLSLQFSKFDRIINFNKKDKTIILEAGIKLSDLLNFTLKHRLWIPQIPGYPSITLGGAVAANVHGKSSGTHGSLRNQIKSIKIFHKTHGWLNLSENEHKEIFELTIGGFGLTGTIVNVELKLMDIIGNNFTTTIEKVNSARDTINKLNINDLDNIFCYSWNKTNNKKKLGEGLIFKNKINENNTEISLNDIEHKTNKIHQYFPLNLWNKHTINFFQNIYFNYYNFYKKKIINDDLKSVIFPYAGKETYFHMFGNNGFIESQILVPLPKVDIFLDELDYNFQNIAPEITLFSIKKILDKDLLLRFSGEGICFTFDFTNNKKNIIFLNKLDQICIKHQLKPSIIKDSRLNSDTVQKCYKEYDIFKKTLLDFDNKRIYRSELSERIGL